jgi:hypothetical protein
VEVIELTIVISVWIRPIFATTVAATVVVTLIIAVSIVSVVIFAVSVVPVVVSTAILPIALATIVVSARITMIGSGRGTVITIVRTGPTSTTPTSFMARMNLFALTILG